jgi:hypothetical protein
LIPSFSEDINQFMKFHGYKLKKLQKLVNFEKNPYKTGGSKGTSPRGDPLF